MSIEQQGFPDSPTFGPPPPYPLESVDNALRVLVLLAQRPRLRNTEIGSFLGVADSTAHRLMAAMSYRGLVRQGPGDRSYRPGPALEQLAIGVVNRMDLRTRLHPLLEELNAEFDETVHLVRLEGADVLFLDAVESSQTLRVVSRLGKLMPAHTTSAGKALLAALDDDEVAARLPADPLPQATPYSIDNLAGLLAELAQIRRRGYAISRQENEQGVESLGLAVGPAHCPPVAGIAVSIPQNRIDAGLRKRVRAALLRTAAAVAERLGDQPEPSRTGDRR